MYGRNVVNFWAPAQSAATTRQLWGGLQGGSPEKGTKKVKSVKIVIGKMDNI